MEILLHGDTPSYLCHGGMQVLAQKLCESLDMIGVDVDYARWWDPSQRCDLIHTFGCPFHLVRMAHEMGIKVVLTHIVDTTTNKPWLSRVYTRCRNSLLRRLVPNKIHELLPWHIYAHMDALVYIHRSDAETAIKTFGIPRERTSIIPHGCSADQISRLRVSRPSGSSYLISVGSIVPRKNSVLLAKAARRSSVPVVFLGKPFNEDSPYFAEFLSLVDGTSVIYPGFVDENEKIRYLTEASGFVLLSEAESGCIAVYEAAVAHLPMLLSSRPWAFSYGDCASIQHVRLDDVRRIAVKLKSFYATSKRQEDPTFPVMTWEDVAKAYVDIYRTTLDNGRLMITK